MQYQWNVLQCHAGRFGNFGSSVLQAILHRSLRAFWDSFNLNSLLKERFHFVYFFLFIHSFSTSTLHTRIQMFSKIRTVKEEVERAKYSKLIICPLINYICTFCFLKHNKKKRGIIELKSPLLKLIIEITLPSYMQSGDAYRGFAVWKSFLEKVSLPLSSCWHDSNCMIKYAKMRSTWEFVKHCFSNKFLIKTS